MTTVREVLEKHFPRYVGSANDNWGSTPQAINCFYNDLNPYIGNESIGVSMEAGLDEVVEAIKPLGSKLPDHPSWLKKTFTDGIEAMCA